MKYRLTLNETQLKELQDACELRFRIDLLQEDMLAEILATIDNLDLSHDNPRHKEIFDAYIDRRAHLNAVLNAAFEIASPWALRGIGRQRDIHSQRVEDIYQVIRKQLFDDYPGEKLEWDVRGRTPIQVSDQDLPTIERIDE